MQNVIRLGLLTTLPNSPSGTGKHIVIKGKVPQGRRRSAIEVYSDERYMTMTGNIFHDRPVMEREGLVQLLWEQMGVPPKKFRQNIETSQKYRDEEIIEQGLSAENGEKFKALLEGRWEQLSYSSQSEADLALINIIAFYTQNREQIRRIFKGSQLGQRSKANRSNYIEPMIDLAFDDQYHFPTRYIGLMQNLPMEFVYYEPRAGGNQVYFGTGIIRNVTEDSEEPGHYYAELADYRPFRTEVDYFTGPNDQSWEAAKSMRSSVRKIDKTIFDTLLEAGGLAAIEMKVAFGTSTAALRQEYAKKYNPNLKYNNPPQLRKIKRLIESFERPSYITNKVKSDRGYSCQLCKQTGFRMRNGKNYCEVHHLFHLSDNPPPECLEPFYLVVLCATCHRRMHYANVGEPQRYELGWRVMIDNELFDFITT